MNIRQLKRLKPRRACQLNPWRPIGYYRRHNWFIAPGQTMSIESHERIVFIEDEIRSDGTMRRTLF
jgi:hypothetical protein